MESQQQENFLQNSVYKNYYNQLILDSFIQKIRRRQQGHAGSKTLRQQNPPVFNWRCQLKQVDLYNGRNMGGWVYSKARIWTCLRQCGRELITHGIQNSKVMSATCKIIISYNL